MEENNKNNEPLNKDFKVPKLRFKSIPANYKSDFISTIFKCVGGGTPSTKNTAFWDGPIPWVGSSSLIENNVNDLLISKHISNVALENSSSKLLAPFSILVVTRVGVGKVAVNKVPLCTSQDFCNLYAKNINSYYFAYLIQHLLIKKISQGSTIQGISSKEIKKIQLNYPSLEEQNKIASFLNIIESKIKILESKINILKKYKEGLIQQALKSTIKVPLNKLINESLNKTVINNQYVLLSSTAKGIFLQSDFFNHQVASKNNIGYKILEEGQIVFSPQNLWLGNINLLTKYKIGCVSPSYKIFDINTKIVDSNYLIEIMRTKLFLHKYKLCSEQGASVVRRNLDLNQFLNIRVPIPSNDKFYSLLKEINYLIEKYL